MPENRAKCTTQSGQQAWFPRDKPLWKTGAFPCSGRITTGCHTHYVRQGREGTRCAPAHLCLGQRADPSGWVGTVQWGRVGPAKQPERQPHSSSGRQRGRALFSFNRNQTTLTLNIYKTGNFRRPPLKNAHLYYKIPGHFAPLWEADSWSVSRTQRECTAHSNRAAASFPSERRDCKSFQKMLNN